MGLYATKTYDREYFEPVGWVHDGRSSKIFLDAVHDLVHRTVKVLTRVQLQVHLGLYS